MSELSDDEVRAALDAAGRGPSDEARRRLRSALFDEPVAPPTDRRRTWVVGGAVAAIAAVIVGALVFAARDDGDRMVVTGGPRDTAPETSTVSTETPTISEETSVAATSTASTAPSSLQEIGGQRWILRERDGVAWTDGIVPFLEFTVSGAFWHATGFDGCNQLDVRGDTAGDELRVGQVIGTKLSCDQPTGIHPAIGNTLRLDEEGRLIDPDAGLVYGSIDEIGKPVTWPDLVGTWQLDGWERAIGVGGVIVQVGNCVMTGSTDGLRLNGWPSPPETCLGSDAPHPANLILTLLTTGPAAGFRVGENLVVIGDASAVQLTPIEPVVDAGRVSLETGAAFGLVPGAAVSVEDELTRLTSILGPVHHDTSWYAVPVTTYEDGTEDCLGGRDYRVLWWGDLSLAFWRTTDGEQLWAWSVGDRRVSLWGDRRESYSPPSAASSGLRTETGIGIGSAEADVVAAYGDRLSKFDSSTGEDFGGTVYDSSGKGWPMLNSGGIGSTFLARDGAVVGIGASLRFC